MGILIGMIGNLGTCGPTVTRAIANACDRTGLSLRAVLISHTRGVREHATPAPTLTLEEPGA